MLTKPQILVLSMVPAASAAEHITAFIIPQYVIKYKNLCDAHLNSVDFCAARRTLGVSIQSVFILHKPYIFHRGSGVPAACLYRLLSRSRKS